MIPDDKAIEALHDRYAQNETVKRLVFDHCQIVAELAKGCAEHSGQDYDSALLHAACLLHDIGTYVYFDEAGHMHNHELYKWHALIGAQLVRDEGYDERLADLIRTHVFLGLTKQEIITANIRLPHCDYEPKTIEGRLLCYADRFHSKDPKFNSFDSFYGGLKETLPRQAERMITWSKDFGVPDLRPLAKRYGHPIT